MPVRLADSVNPTLATEAKGQSQDVQLFLP